MTIAIIFSSILYLLGLFFIVYKLEGAPISCFLGMLVLSMGHTSEGYPIVPLGNGLILGWLFLSVFVTVLTLCQPRGVRQTRRGIYYYLAGSLTGLAIGLLGFTFTNVAGIRYVVMIIAVAAGTFLGGLSYSRTPEGKNVGTASGRFFSYMLAKGFPTAISVMELGTVLVTVGL